MEVLQLMRESVEKGEEAMPQRARADNAGAVQQAVGVRKQSPAIRGKNVDIRSWK